MRATKVARSALNNHTKIMEKALHDGVPYIHELDDLVKEFEKKAMNLEKTHIAYINILQDSELDETIEEIDTYVSNRKKKYQFGFYFTCTFYFIMLFSGNFCNSK